MVSYKRTAGIFATLTLAVAASPMCGFAASVSTQAAIPRHVRSLAELRNANVTNDAIARAIDAQREREAYRTIAPNVRVVSANLIGESQARKAGIRVAATNRLLTLVTVHLRDAKGVVWEHQYVYDNSTHLCLGFTERIGFSAGRNKPTTPVVF